MSFPRVRSLIVLFVLLGTAVSTAPVHAQELLVPKSTTRKFPQGVYCPIPLEMTFVADGPTATLRFSTTTVNYFNDEFGIEENRWSRQILDNICVSTEAAYQANLGPLGSYSSDCYFPHPDAQLTQVFYFQNAGAMPLREEFDSDPAGTGWDLANNCNWNTDPNETAPHDPGTDLDFLPVGGLGLGNNTVAKALTDSAFTTKQVSGLTKGETYRLTGWWTVDDMQLDKITMTIAVLSDKPTPLARKTWGGLKHLYRETKTPDPSKK